MTHLVFGGSASGKSVFAEDLSLDYPQPRVYVATMQPWDEECLKRIEKHQKQRKNKGFSTLECYGSLVNITTDVNSTVLLECMGNLVANLQFADHPPQDILMEICNSLDALAQNCKNLIVVSNDIFLEEPANSPETLDYLQFLGAINRHMAATFDQVVELVYGIPIHHKGGA